MALVHGFRVAVLGASLAACALPAVAQSDPWQSHLDYLEGRAQINGILLRQDIERVRKGQPSTAAIRDLPTIVYPMPTQSAGSGGITARPNGDVEVARGIRATGPASQTIDVEVREVYPRAKVARRIVEALPIVGTAVSGALLISDLIDAARIMEGPGGTILMDQGEAKESRTVWQQNDFGTPAVCQTSTPGATLDCGQAKVLEVWSDAVGACDVTNVQVYESQWRRGFYPLRRGWEGGTYCDYSNGRTVTAFRKTALACRDGQVISFWQDDWCTTPPEDWEVADVDTGAQRIDLRMGLYPGQTPELLRELDEKGIGVGGPLPTVTGPGSIHSGRETTSNPDGSTTVKDTSHDIRYGPTPAADGTVLPGWDWNTRQEIRTYPPGETVPPPGGDTAPPNGGGTVTEGPGGTGLEDLITCGLPWTPPCKIDETGTPQAPPDTSGADAEGIMTELRACLLSPSACLPELPDLSWAFALPEGCTPLELSAFEMTLDVCQFQPIIHDLLSMLWVAAGLFGAVAMVSREAMGGGA